LLRLSKITNKPFPNQNNFLQSVNGTQCRKRLSESPVGDAKDEGDDKISRWGRSRTEGYKKFKHRFYQPAPIFFTQDHHPLWLGDLYRGRSAFLIGGGVSFLKVDCSKLKLPGILTAGMNNSLELFVQISGSA
jgi:hypothetical protein